MVVMLGLAGCGGESFPLVRDGKPAPIVIPAEAEASTELAAKELADYVEKITGFRPALLTNDCTRVPRVEIGTLNTMHDLPEAVIRKFDESPSWESHVVTCDKDVLRIVGRDEVAELYGTYQFLEEKLDVRWFKQWMPEDDGEYVPSKKELLVPAYVKFRAPFFRFRTLNQTGASCGYVPVRGIEWTVRLGLQPCPFRDRAALAKRHLDKVADRQVHREHWETMKPRVQRQNFSLGGGHMMFHDAIRSNQYFATHPEYFALRNGKRVDQYSRRCMSNPDVQRIVADDILRRFDANGGKGTYLFGLMDGTAGTCECDACHALDSAEERKKPLNKEISTRFHSCMKRIADLVYAKRPDATLINWAYSNYRTPPEGVKLDPRTGVEFCIHGRCYGHPLADPNCKRNPRMLAWLKRWLEAASWVKLYEYAHCSGCFYGCYETILGDDLRLYKRLGVKGWHEEMNYADSHFVPESPKGQFDKRREYTLSKWQWLYLAGKLTWDPDQDDKAILADAEEKYYGAAYPEMKEYQACRRQLWRNGPICFAYGDYPMRDERTRTLMSIPGAKEKLLGCLDRAENLVANDPKRLYRVRQDRDWLQRYWIEPNEQLKKTVDPTLRAQKRMSPVVIDGDDSDPTWGNAGWATVGTPDRTDVAALSDEDGFYFLFRYRGSREELKRDHLGVVLYPPDADNTGKSYTFTADLKTGAKGTETGYTAELRAPVGRRLRRGEIWRVKFFRNPDGNEPDIRYPLEVGETWLKNGSFESVDDKGQARGWKFTGKETKLVDLTGGLHAVKLGDILQLQCDTSSLFSCPHPRKVRISFRAWGVGKVSVTLIRYDKKSDGPNISGGQHEVAKEPRYFSAVCEIPAGEWVALMLRGAWQKGVTNNITIDDVAITCEDKRDELRAWNEP